MALIEITTNGDNLDTPGFSFAVTIRSENLIAIQLSSVQNQKGRIDVWLTSGDNLNFTCKTEVASKALYEKIKGAM